MKQELYLNKVHKWNEIWNEIRHWIEHSPHSAFGRAGAPTHAALPTKVALGEWGDENERVKITPIGDKRLIVTYTKVGRDPRASRGRAVCPKPPLTWTTRIDFKRAKNSIYTCVEVSANHADVEIKTPRIIAILKKRFGDMNPSVGHGRGTKCTAEALLRREPCQRQPRSGAQAVAPCVPAVGRDDPIAPSLTKDDLKAAVSEIKSHIDSKASSLYEASDVELKPSFMATALGVSEKQMRRYLKDDDWKKEYGFPGTFIKPQSFIKWADPIRNNRALAKAARTRAKNKLPRAPGHRKSDY